MIIITPKKGISVMKGVDEKVFELPYWISNNGDGSASIQLCETSEEAAKADEDQQQNGDGWGEPSADSIKLKLDNGKIYFQGRDEGHKRVWKELKSV
jgi:hypothetical protein